MKANTSDLCLSARLGCNSFWRSYAAISTTILLGLAIFSSPCSFATGSGRFAVLDLKDTQGMLSQAEVNILSDDMRMAARSTLPVDRYIVMTRENIIQLLPPGSSISDCVGACAVETGRNIGAQHILSGEYISTGGGSRITISLYDIESANLISSQSVFGASISELEKNLVNSVVTLLLYLPGAAPDQMEIYSAAEKIRRDMLNSRHQKNRIITVSAGLALIGAGYFHYEANSAYDDHLAATSVSEAASTWDDYTSGIRKRNLTLGVASGLILWRLIRQLDDPPSFEKIRAGLIEERRLGCGLRLGSSEDIVFVSHRVRF